MDTLRFDFSSDFPSPAAALWSFHMRPEALDVLAPPLSGFEVEDRGDGVADGSVLKAFVGFGPFRQRWTALHCGVEPGRAFTDIALEAPFSYWVHTHFVESAAEGGSRLTDTVWVVPPRWMPRRLARPLLGSALALFFAWRHRATRKWLSAHADSSETRQNVNHCFETGGRS